MSVKAKKPPAGNHSPHGRRISLLALPQILDILLCQLTGRLPALCPVWCVQLKTEPPLSDLKCETTVLIVIHQPALGRVLSRILTQTVFEGSVVGTHLNDRACLVKKDAGRLLLLGKTCSHKTSAFSQIFSGSTPKKVSGFSDRKHPNDTLSV